MIERRSMIKPSAIATVITLLLWLSAFSAFAQSSEPGSEFRDCDDCPEMVVLPPGTFAMGSNGAEAGRDPDEGPVRKVTIAYRFGISRFEITRAQFARFVAASGHVSLSAIDCHNLGLAPGLKVNDTSGFDWRDPGFPQADDHPVVCIDWNDAKAYATWLSHETGHSYRLLSEAEWEYAARAGSIASRPWGDNPHAACQFANVGDHARERQILLGSNNKRTDAHHCEDGSAYTAPVGSYAPNRFGLHDMIGNVWEWTEDCWNESYVGAPTDGSAWLAGDCTRRVDRGASWNSTPRHTRSANRDRNTGAFPRRLVGFRLARDFEADEL